MNMSYTITISKTETVNTAVGKEWRVVDQDIVISGDKPITKDVYGYTPEIIKDVESQREIFKQTVHDLDLMAVIKAINEIK